VEAFYLVGSVRERSGGTLFVNAIRNSSHLLWRLFVSCRQWHSEESRDLVGLLWMGDGFCSCRFDWYWRCDVGEGVFVGFVLLSLRTVGNMRVMAVVKGYRVHGDGQGLEVFPPARNI